MDFEEYFWMFVKSFNPNQYEHLLQHPLRRFFAFIAGIIAISLLIYIAILVPITYNYIDGIPARTADVERMHLSADVAAETPIILLERPGITLDLAANGTPTGEFTLTNEGIFYPKYVFFGTGLMKWEDMNDLKNQTPERDRLLATIIIFLLPSIIFWFFLYSMLKILIVFGLLILLGYVGPRIFRHTISGKDVTKLALLSLPSLIIMDFALYPLAPLFWWGLLLTSALFFIGVALICDLPDEHPRHQGKV